MGKLMNWIRKQITLRAASPVYMGRHAAKIKQEIEMEMDFQDSIEDIILSDLDQAEKMIKADLATFGSVQSATESFISGKGHLSYINGVLTSHAEGEPEDWSRIVDGKALSESILERGQAVGKELAIKQSEVPPRLLQKYMKPGGYILEDGTVLLESEHDREGYYCGGADVDGMYLKTDSLYVPIFDDSRQLRAFQKVIPWWDKDSAVNAPQKDPEAINTVAQQMTAQAANAAAYEQAADLEPA